MIYENVKGGESDDQIQCLSGKNEHVLSNAELPDILYGRG